MKERKEKKKKKQNNDLHGSFFSLFNPADQKCSLRYIDFLDPDVNTLKIKGHIFGRKVTGYFFIPLLGTQKLKVLIKLKLTLLLNNN